MKKQFCKFLTALVLVNASAGIVMAKDFSDLTTTHWAYQQIKALHDDQVVVGYPDGSFKADNAVTRAEFATMVVKALKQENSPLTATFDFVDVPYSHWAYATIERAISFNLIKGFPDGTFKPNDGISKAEAVAVIVSSVNVGSMTEEQAKDALKNYIDVDKIPAWAIIPAGQSEKLNMTAHDPADKNNFKADKKVTRADVAVNLYNMRLQALKNPNDKLTEVLKPKMATGIILNNVAVNDNCATIPKGSFIPVVLTKTLSSQKDQNGEVFVAKTPDNIVTKEHFLLIPKDSGISGQITNLKHAIYFIRNGKMVLDTNYINICANPRAEFPGNINTDKPYKNWFTKAVRFVIKGRKVVMPDCKTVYIKTSKDIKVDLVNTVILDK